MVPYILMSCCNVDQNNIFLFLDFEKSTWNRRMVLFQEAILMRRVALKFIRSCFFGLCFAIDSKKSFSLIMSRILVNLVLV